MIVEILVHILGALFVDLCQKATNNYHYDCALRAELVSEYTYSASPYHPTPGIQSTPALRTKDFPSDSAVKF